MEHAGVELRHQNAKVEFEEVENAERNFWGGKYRSGSRGIKL